MMAATLALAMLPWSHAPARSSVNLSTLADLLRPAHSTSRLIVRYRSDVDMRGRQAVASAYNWRTALRLQRVGYDVVELEGMSVEAALALAADDDRIVYAEPDYRVSVTAIPDDAEFWRQWGMHNTGQTGGTPDADIDAVEAWDAGTGQIVVVGIIDTGIDDEHADLRDHLWVNPGEIPDNGIDDDHNGFVDDIHGWDFLHDDNDPDDDHGHGTHVAGVIAGIANNEIGIAGLCATARIMPLKFLDEDGFGYTSDAVRALEYASAMGAVLTNNSWGSTGQSQALRDMIDSVSRHGMLCVIAAGNAGNNVDAIPYYPAAYDLDNIIAVAATDDDDSLASEDKWASNYGRRSVDIAAPGVKIFSTLPGSTYGLMSGTSMATPSVTGVAALVWSLVPSLNALEVRGRILQSVDLLPTLINKCATGGRLNAQAAVAGIESNPPAAVMDLTVVATKSSSAKLRWTAPGDDGAAGRATAYDLRMSKSPIDSANFAAAVSVPAMISPGEPGATEEFTVEELDFSSSYYFAVRTVDDWYNAGPLSNVPMAMTLGPPSVQVTPASISDSLRAGEHADHLLYVANLGSGELRYRLRGVYNYDLTSRDDAYRAGAADIGIKDVLLLYADAGATGLKAILESYPDIGRVDLWQAGLPDGTIPSVAELRAYDAVVTWNNFAWVDIYGIGDHLADYIDSGGAVVALVDCWANKQFSSFGRYFTDPRYSPFVSAGRALFEVRTLGEYQATHPLMRGVDSLVISKYYNQVSLTPGAQAVAYWDNGTPLVATQGRSVAINVYPGDGYHWFGDFPRLIHNAVSYAAGESFWVEAGAQESELAPLWDTTIVLTVSAANLIAGRYEAQIVLESNDPLQPEAAIDVKLKVTGEPELTTDGDSIDVGQSYVHYASTSGLRIYNTGSDTLVVSGLESLAPEFMVESHPVRIAPRELYEAQITFTPGAPGTVSGDVVIRSNDPLRPEHTIRVWGTGVLPPSIDMDRDQFAFDVITGQHGYDTIRITNTGVSDLRLDISVKATPQTVRTDTGSGGGTGVQSNDDDTGRWLAVNDRYSPAWPHHGLSRAVQAADSPGDIDVLVWKRFVDDSPGGELENTLDIVTSMVPNARIEVTSLSDPDSLAAKLAGHHVFLIPEQENAIGTILTIGESWKPVLDAFVRTGGMVIECGEWGAAKGFLTKTGLMTVSAAGQTSRTSVQVQELDHPLMENVKKLFPGTDATRWYNVMNHDATVVAIEASAFGSVVIERRIGLGRVVLIGFDYYSYEDDMAQILANAVMLSTRSLAWLTLDPLSATVPPDSTATIVVHVDPTDLTGGDYTAHAVVRSNDPERPVVSVSVGLHLVDVPMIATSPDTLDFGEVYVGYSRTDSIWLANSGPAPLIASGLYSNDDHFVPMIGSLEVATDTSGPVGVQFSPDAAGEFSGALTIASNDPRQPEVTVALRGVGLWPPVAATAPDSIAFDLPIGAAGDKVITLRNDGGSELAFRVERELAGSGWSDPSPESNDSSRVLLPTASQWEACAPMPIPVRDPTVVAHPNGLVYVIGGFTGVGLMISNEVQIYDPARDAWHFGTPLEGEASGVAAVVGHDGWIYCFRNSTYDAGVKYDVTRDRWAKIASPLSVPVPTRGAVTGSDGRIYVFGGALGSKPFNTVQIYDPVANNWSWGPEMPDSRMDMTALAGMGDSMYVLGGTYCNGCISDRTMWIYNLRAESWQDADSIPTHKLNYGACVGIDKRVYTMGGRQYLTIENGAVYDMVEIYDPLTQTWSNGLPLAEPMSEFQPVSVGSQLFVIGGTDGAISGKCWSLDLMPWLQASPTAGVILSGGSVEIAVSNSTRDIPPGTHHTRLRIVTNDPAQMARHVPVTLMVGNAADAVVSPDSVDFGDVFIGYPQTRTVWLSNRGSRALEVSGLLVAGAGFTVLDPVTSVPAGDSAAIRIECQAVEITPLAGTLQIETNDPDQSNQQVVLRGNGLEAPVLATAPGRFDFDLHVGDTGTGQLEIENRGGSDLRWRCDELLFESAAGITRKTASGWVGYSPYPLWSLEGYRVGMDMRGGQDTVLQNDLLTRGARIVAMNYPMPAGILDSVDVIVLNSGTPLLWDTDIAALRDWMNGGGGILITYSASNYSTEKLRRLLAGSGIAPAYGWNLGAAVQDLVPHPVTTGVESMFVGVWRTSLGVGPPSQAVGFDDAGLAMMAAGPLGAGRVVVVAGDLIGSLRRSLVGNLTFLNRSIDWLVTSDLVTVDPQAGTLAPGETASINVTLDGARRSGYDDEFAALVISNDPVTDTLRIPVHVTIRGDAILEAARDTTDFRVPGQVGYSVVDKVTIWNRGQGALEVSQVESSNPVLEPLETAFKVPPFERHEIPVRFSPVDTGIAIATLSIASNAVNQSVASLVVRAAGRFAPRLVTATDTVYVNTESGEFTSHFHPVDNQGAGDLEYNVSLEFQYDAATAGWRGGTEGAFVADAAGVRSARGTAELKPELAGLGQTEISGADEWRYYTGGHMEIGITEAGQIRPVTYPELSAHLTEYHTSGYTAGFYRNGTDQILHTAGWVPAQRMIEVSNQELVNTDRLAVVETVVASLDSALEIRRVITFDKRDRWVNIQTSLTNLSEDPLDSVIFKEYADWDVDNAYDSNIWDYDTTRNLVYATQTRSAGTASLNKPKVMDLEGRDDWLLRRTTLSYPVGGQRFDGMAIHHFDLGTLLPGRTAEVVVAMGVGDTKEDLFHVIDRGLHKLNWLWTDDRAGVLNAGAAKDFEFQLDARWLYAGRYVAVARIESNDPEAPQVVIPFVFDVSGTPVAEVGVDSLDFGAVLVGYPETLYVPIANTGTAVLTVTDVQSDIPELMFEPQPLIVPPDHLDTVAVIITAVERRTINDWIRLHTDDPTAPAISVRVKAKADWPGAASIAPDSIALVMPKDDTVHVTVGIVNSGRGLLYWSAPQFGGTLAGVSAHTDGENMTPVLLEARKTVGPVRQELPQYRSASGAEMFAAAVAGLAHLTLSPVSGNVKPDSVQNVDLRVTTWFLREGMNDAAILFETNDPDAADIVLPVRVRMFVPERGDVNIDERVNQSDILYLNNSLWGRGPDPFGRTGDMDCDRGITMTDVMILFNYVFRGGPPDVCD